MPLLLVSGRRLTEICSPRSAFTAVAGRPHHAVFEGALKKRGHTPAFAIPLLVPFEMFHGALRILRQKQGDGVAAMTNAAIKTRYQPTVSRELAAALPDMP